jgi:AP-4 complex subunit epsilon-1
MLIGMRTAYAHSRCTACRTFKDASTRGYIVTALMKLAAQSGVLVSEAEQLIAALCESAHTDLQQRCLEFQALVTKHSAVMIQVLPVDARCVHHLTAIVVL